MTVWPGYYPPILGPDPEWLGQAFLTPLMSSVSFATRMPELPGDSATQPAFVRIESGDTVHISGLFGAAWDTTFVLHSYSPNEVEAADNSRTAMAYVAAATGLTVVGWYIVCVPTVIGGRRLSDPEVPANIVRYRSAVTWRVAGQPLT